MLSRWVGSFDFGMEEWEWWNSLSSTFKWSLGLFKSIHQGSTSYFNEHLLNKNIFLHTFAHRLKTGTEFEWIWSVARDNEISIDAQIMRGQSKLWKTCLAKTIIDNIKINQAHNCSQNLRIRLQFEFHSS